MRIGNILRWFLHKMKRTTKEDYEITCPDCDESYQYLYSLEEREGCTADCLNCGSLLVFWEGETKNFHKHLNRKTDGLWPEDGEGTGYVEVQ